MIGIWVLGSLKLYPLVQPICFVFAWFFVLSLISGFISAARDAWRQAKQLHQIPCAHCEYFTGDYRLKCTVRPDTACTKEAINCRDFCVKEKSSNLRQVPQVLRLSFWFKQG
ncbi:MAG: hypothetical protein AAGG02_00545 [Cyanobacteria bacterium P01_H01_bin.15]